MSRCDWTTGGEEDKIVSLNNIMAVTYHVGGEVVLDAVPQDLVCPVPAATEDDPGDLMVGGDSASPRHLNIVLLHCHRADLVPADNIIEVVAVHEIMSRVSTSHHQSNCGLIVLRKYLSFSIFCFSAKLSSP